MKASKRFLAIVTVLLMVLLQTCTMEKRLHRPGFHIALRNSRISAGKQDPQSESQQATARRELHLQVCEISDELPGETKIQESLEAKTSDTVITIIPTQLSPKVLPIGVSKIEKTANQLSNCVEEIKKIRSTTIKQAVEPDSHPGNGIRALLIVLVAVALLGLGLIFYNILGVFGIVLAVVFFMAGGILLIAGILTLFVGK
jgi:hypothetical protein